MSGQFTKRLSSMWWFFCSLIGLQYFPRVHALDACCTSCGVNDFTDCINHSVVLNTTLMTKVQSASWPWISISSRTDPHIYLWLLSGGHFGSSALEVRDFNCFDCFFFLQCCILQELLQKILTQNTLEHSTMSYVGGSTCKYEPPFCLF